MLEDFINLLKDGAKEFGVILDDNKCGNFSEYARLLKEWNEKINLTAITDEEGIVIKHFIDSLSVSGFIESGKSLIDVGTGAGFPGIPLKICRENLSVTLLDSLDKRIKFLNDIISKLSLDSITAVHGRAEDFGVKTEYREKYDYAVARAVSDLSVLSEYCLPFVKMGGFFIAMKGPDIDKELLDSKKAISTLGGEIAEKRNLILPFSTIERTIIFIKKCRHTPSAYPRKSGKPTKSPIR